MTGITSFGGYVPWLFLERKTIFGAMGWFNPATFGVARGQKAVANHDEDTLTMAVEAGRDCLPGGARTDALFLASTTLPYRERMNAAIAAEALSLGGKARVADFTGSLRAGTTALWAALDAVAAGSAGDALVLASDSRLGKMGSAAEHLLGDGAAAIGVGQKDVIAELVGATCLTADFPDHVRGEADRFDRVWEERWVQTEGYGAMIPKALAALCEQTKVKPADIATWAIACPARALGGFAKKAGIAPERFQDSFADTVGDCGAAQPLMMLVGALEKAKAGDLIAVCGFGSGADALLFRATDKLAAARSQHRGVAGHLAARRDLGSYERYAVYRRLLPLEVGIRGEANPPTAHSVLYRERRAVLGLEGARCQKCGTPQYPPQRICIHPECGAVDQMAPYAFAPRTASIFTFTGDNLAFSLDPPAVYGLVDFEGGGRLQLDFTDCVLKEVKVGMAVEPTFRRKYLDEQRAVSGYFWKVRPVRGAAPASQGKEV
jgi:3-hydroxy-3-methylglutaryl CoA synthase